MSEEYIRKQDVIEILKIIEEYLNRVLDEDIVGVTRKTYECELDLIKSCIEGVEELSSADVASVVHAKWIYHPNWEIDGECAYQCPKCQMGSDVDYNYCMRCGTKMNGWIYEGEE